jgi:hypothetical protein
VPVSSMVARTAPWPHSDPALRVSRPHHWYANVPRCRFAPTGQLQLGAADGPIGPGSHQPGAHAQGHNRREDRPSTMRSPGCTASSTTGKETGRRRRRGGPAAQARGKPGLCWSASATLTAPMLLPGGDSGTPWTSTPTLVSPKPPKCAPVAIPARTQLRARPAPGNGSGWAGQFIAPITGRSAACADDQPTGRAQRRVGDLQVAAGGGALQVMTLRDSWASPDGQLRSAHGARRARSLRKMTDR